MKEIDLHLFRIENAFTELSKRYSFPFSEDDFAEILSDSSALAFADQIIYRFSKAQDSMAAKLFKALNGSVKLGNRGLTTILSCRD